MNHSIYRPDIDGLRAFAVIIVIFFHLDIDLFKGGFVGVDIFFVISGFLITRLIRDEVIEKKTFSYFNFYIRRAMRLFPSLFFTLCLCFVSAYLLFSPQHFERFSGSLLFTLMSMSNLFFWNESGYFNTASEFKPLLHTWSLSVEEQFYLVWPLLIVIILTKTKKQTHLILLLLIGVFSFFLNQVFIDNGSFFLNRLFPMLAEWFSDGMSTIFFLFPFRVFEFIIGAMVVWLIQFQPKGKIIREIIVLTGIGMIIYPVCTYTKDIIFPSYNAIFPCVGTAMLIYSGSAHYCGKIFKTRFAVCIGLISYSLYLIHWPIIVFYKYWKIDDLVILDKCTIFILSIVAAVFMYWYVEQPFRTGSLYKTLSPISFGITSIVLATSLGLLSVNVWVNNGWIWRFPKEVVHQLSFKRDHFHEYVWIRQNKLERNFANSGKPKILVIGDSMAADFINLLAESNNIEKFDLVSIPVREGCKSVFPVPEYTYHKFLTKNFNICKEQHKAIMESHLLKQADSVVLATSWNDWNVDLIDSTVEFLKKKGVSQVAIIGNKKQSVNGIKFIAKYGLRKSAHNFRTPVSQETEIINTRIKRLKSDFLFIDLLDSFCDDKGCQRVTDAGHLIIYDKLHFSPEGAKFIGLKITTSEWIRFLENKTKFN